MDTPQIVALTLLIINNLLCAIALPFLIVLRNVQPIKARSMTLLIALLFTIVINQVKHFREVFYGRDCLTEFWLTFFGTNALTFLCCFRPGRLLAIFNITRSRVLIEGRADGSSPKWYLNVEYAKEPFIKKAVLLLFLVLSIVPIIATIYAKIKNYEGEEYCNLVWAQSFSYLFFGLAIILIVFLAIQLRKVHDGFWLKDEFRIQAIFLAILLPLIVVFEAIVHKPFATNFLYMSGMIFIVLTSYIVPIIKAIRVKISEKRTQSNQSSSENNINSTSEMIDFTSFTEYPKLAKLMNDGEVITYLNSYIVHFHEMAMSDALTFWIQIREFRKIEQREFLAGKAYLLFLKYLKKDGYRYIDCMTESELQQLEQKITESIEENGPQLEQSFFDHVSKNLEKLMMESLFPGFFKSKFYEEYRSATRLKLSLETVIVK